jgi:hypothetical protein
VLRLDVEALVRFQTDMERVLLVDRRPRTPAVSPRSPEERIDFVPADEPRLVKEHLVKIAILLAIALLLFAIAWILRGSS